MNPMPILKKSPCMKYYKQEERYCSIVYFWSKHRLEMEGVSSIQSHTKQGEVGFRIFQKSLQGF